MASNYVQLVTDASNTGKKIDTVELTVSANTVERQVVVLGDPSGASSIAAVKAASTLAQTTDPALVVRPLGWTDGTNTAPTMDAGARRGFQQLSDGTNSQLSGSAANLAAQTAVNAMLTTDPGQWTATHAPAVNTQATASKVAGGAGVRHVCTGISINLAAGGTAPTATQLTVNLRDGATGVGTILATWTIAIPATAGAFATVNLTGLKIPGTANTAMTLEFTAAGGANVYESVTLFGHDTV